MNPNKLHTSVQKHSVQKKGSQVLNIPIEVTLHVIIGSPTTVLCMATASNYQ